MTVPLPFVGMCAESFIYSLANAVLSSVAQGLQPLWGNSYGKQDTKEINDYFRFGMAINLMLSVLVSAVLILFDEPAIRIFSQDMDLIHFCKIYPLNPVFSHPTSLLSRSRILFSIRLTCTWLIPRLLATSTCVLS